LLPEQSKRSLEPNYQTLLSNKPKPIFPIFSKIKKFMALFSKMIWNNLQGIIYYYKKKKIYLSLKIKFIINLFENKENCKNLILKYLKKNYLKLRKLFLK
jgi:ferric iron reductase protein FhuF